MFRMFRTSRDISTLRSQYTPFLADILSLFKEEDHHKICIDPSAIGFFRGYSLVYLEGDKSKTYSDDDVDFIISESYSFLVKFISAEDCRNIIKNFSELENKLLSVGMNFGAMIGRYQMSNGLETKEVVELVDVVRSIIEGESQESKNLRDNAKQLGMSSFALSVSMMVRLTICQVLASRYSSK